MRALLATQYSGLALPLVAQSQRALEAFLGRRPFPGSRRADVESGQKIRFWELRGRLALRLLTTSAKVVMYGRVGSPTYNQIITRGAQRPFEFGSLRGLVLGTLQTSRQSLCFVRKIRLADFFGLGTDTLQMRPQKCVQRNIDLAGNLFDDLQPHFDAVILAQNRQQGVL